MTALDTWLYGALADGEPVMFKRLSANDTWATRSHQAGPYVPKRVAFSIVPALRHEADNPRRTYDFLLLSHGQAGEVTLIYYNRAKDECHLTGLGGRSSALQDPENTSAILVLVFRREEALIQGWLARSVEEEDVIEAALGTVEPGTVGYSGPGESGDLTEQADYGTMAVAVFGSEGTFVSPAASVDCSASPSTRITRPTATFT
jgi:hypothetical protein